MIKVSQISQSARTKFVALLLGLTPTLRLSFLVKGKELKRNRVFFSSFIPFKDITAISLSSLHPFPYPNLSRPPTQFLIFPFSLGRLSFPLPTPFPPSPLPPFPPLPVQIMFSRSFLTTWHVACFSQGRCKVVRKQEVLDMSKTTKLPSITTVTRKSPRKLHRFDNDIVPWYFLSFVRNKTFEIASNIKIKGLSEILWSCGTKKGILFQNQFHFL